MPTTEFGNNVPSLQKKIMMFALASPRFVSFMGSHLSTLDEAARALGGLVKETRFDGVSGRYFDGFKETLPSVESRDELKAKAVWQQAAALIKRPEREPSFTRSGDR